MLKYLGKSVRLSVTNSEIHQKIMGWVEEEING